MTSVGAAAGAAMVVVLLAGACSGGSGPPVSETSTTTSTATTSTSTSTATTSTSTSTSTTSTTVVPLPVATEVPATVLAATRAATYSVRGLDCRKAQVGTAFLVASDLLATSAHVVAGIESPILRVGSSEVSSRVVAFDPVSDLAVLRVGEDLGEPLSLGSAVVGSAVALVAFDDDSQPIERQLIVQQAIRATGEDIYGDIGGGRDALLLEGSVARGNSGGPVVDEDGAVVGVMFANSRGDAGTSFAVQAGELRALLDEVGDRPVPPTDCR